MLTPHGPHSRECDATYPCSGLKQHAYRTNKPNHFKKIDAELLKIIIENGIVYNFLDFDKEVIRRPLMGPILWKVMLRTPSLSQHTFWTNKHNHLKNMRGWVT